MKYRSFFIICFLLFLNFSCSIYTISILNVSEPYKYSGLISSLIRININYYQNKDQNLLDLLKVNNMPYVQEIELFNGINSIDHNYQVDIDSVFFTLQKNENYLKMKMSLQDSTFELFPIEGNFYDSNSLSEPDIILSFKLCFSVHNNKDFEKTMCKKRIYFLSTVNEKIKINNILWD